MLIKDTDDRLVIIIAPPLIPDVYSPCFPIVFAVMETLGRDKKESTNRSTINV